MKNPFHYFKSSPELIRLAVVMYIRYPLSLRQVEDLLFERGIDICHETVRFWWHRFGPMFAAEIRNRRIQDRSYSRWRWHLDEVFVQINGETHYLYGRLSRCKSIRAWAAWSVANIYPASPYLFGAPKWGIRSRTPLYLVGLGGRGNVQARCAPVRPVQSISASSRNL